MNYFAFSAQTNLAKSPPYVFVSISIGLANTDSAAPINKIILFIFTSTMSIGHVLIIQCLFWRYSLVEVFVLFVIIIRFCMFEWTRKRCGLSFSFILPWDDCTSPYLFASTPYLSYWPGLALQLPCVELTSAGQTTSLIITTILFAAAFHVAVSTVLRECCPVVTDSYPSNGKAALCSYRVRIDMCPV